MRAALERGVAASTGGLSNKAVSRGEGLWKANEYIDERRCGKQAWRHVDNQHQRTSIASEQRAGSVEKARASGKRPDRRGQKIM